MPAIAASFSSTKGREGSEDRPSPLLQFIVLDRILDLVRLGFQLVTECLELIRPLALGLGHFALSFGEAEAPLRLSHEVLDVLLDEHPALR